MKEKKLFKYDDNSNVSEINNYHSDDNLIQIEVFNYDDRGNRIEEKIFKQDGFLSNKSTFEYNKDDKLIKKQITT